MKFLSAKEKGTIAIFGIPFDSTTCFRPGARFGPDGIRFFSENLEEYSPELKKSLEELDFVDLGNVECGASVEDMVNAVEKFVEELLRDSFQKLVVLGGEHSVTYPVVKGLKKFHEDLTVVHFDAHADLREKYSGTPFSHACVMKRVLELNCSIVQVGIRSGTREEFNLIERGDTIKYCRTLGEFIEIVSGLDTPLYFTLDIDFFDPAYAPGTGTPEPCGFSPVEFFKAIYKLPPINVVGFDVVEVSPPYDPSGTTQVLGAKIVRELMLKFWG